MIKTINFLCKLIESSNFKLEAVPNLNRPQFP